MPGIEVGGAGVNVNPQNIADSPAYKFRQQQGQQGVERSAAGRGTLLTGGTLADLAEFNSGLASQEYGNEWQRQFGLASLNADISSGNASRNLSGLGMLYSGGLNAAGNMAGMYGQSGQAGAAGTYGQANAINAGIGGVAGSLGEYFSRQQAARQPPPPVGGQQTSVMPGRTSGGWGSV